MNRRDLLLRSALMAPLLGAAFASRAQSAWPARPIHLVVPFAPGGAVDVWARMVQPDLSRVLGQPIIIDNKTGASGMIGMESVARAPADGYTFVVGNISTFAINPGIFHKMPYDPQKDLTLVAKTVEVNYVLVVTPGLPIHSTSELIAYAKAHPGQLSFGSSGVGSAQHIAAELFKARTGTEMLHVPYKGTGALASDLVAGHVSLAFADEASMMPQVRGGKLRLLAVGGSKRSPDQPDVSTVAESGNIPGYEAVAWQGIAGPAGLPPDITNRMAAAIAEVQALPELRRKLHDAGLVADASGPADFSAYVHGEMQKWAKVAQDAHIEGE